MKALTGQAHLVLENGKKIKMLTKQGIPSTNEPSLHDLFIAEFNHLRFSDEEKKVLSLNHRRAIFYFTKGHNHEFEQGLRMIIKMINAQKGNKLNIEAKEWGANLVYAALFSGKIDPQKEIYLHFTDSPLALIPKDYFKCMKPKNLSLHLSISPTSWMNELKSLATPTTHQLIKKLSVA